MVEQGGTTKKSVAGGSFGGVRGRGGVLLALCLLLQLSLVAGWRLGRVSPAHQTQRVQEHRGLRVALASSLAALLCLPGGSVVSPSFGLISPAAVIADNVEGSKTDKKFELCVSKCIFSETRPPPAGSSVERLEARERGAIIRECRQGCAKTKEQLLTGEPKSKRTPQKTATPAEVAVPPQ